MSKVKLQLDKKNERRINWERKKGTKKNKCKSLRNFSYNKNNSFSSIYEIDDQYRNNEEN